MNNIIKDIKTMLLNTLLIGKIKFNAIEINDKKIAPKKAISHMSTISNFIFFLKKKPEEISINDDNIELKRIFNNLF
jgi:hypothetical protein